MENEVLKAKFEALPSAEHKLSAIYDQVLYVRTKQNNELARLATLYRLQQDANAMLKAIAFGLNISLPPAPSVGPLGEASGPAPDQQQQLETASDN